MQTRKIVQHHTFSILLIILAFNFFSKEIFADNIYGRLKATQCDSLIKANEVNPNFVILDVRTPGEWSSYHLLGSINRSSGLSDIDQQLDALPKHKVFLLHCQSGGRSAGVFQKMKNLNFTEVYEMIGGLNSWNSAGLPTTTITQPKLMLVSYETVSGSLDDTLKVTITNRANGVLSFTSATFNDLHQVSDNFNLSSQIQGAFDYSFSVIHSTHYSGVDSTQVTLESNGGELDLNIVFKNGVIQGIQERNVPELVIYPNPAHERLYLKNTGDFDEISIVNINGQTLLNKSGFLISNGVDVFSLQNGIYVLRLKTDGNIIAKKFVIKH